jgi:2-phosphoglycerate kinase
LQAGYDKNYHANDEFIDMVSAENKVIAGFITLAVILLFGIHSVSEPPTWVSGAVVIGVGVIVPTLINEYLTRQEQS